MRPVDKDLIGHREPQRRREDRACIAHGHVEPEDLADAGEGRGEVDRPKDDHAGRRCECLDEHGDVVRAGFAARSVAAHAAAARCHLADHVAPHHPIEAGIAEGAGPRRTRLRPVRSGVGRYRAITRAITREVDPGSGARSRDHRRHRCRPILGYRGRDPLDRRPPRRGDDLDEHVHRSPAGEADSDRVVVAVPEAHEPRRAVVENVERLGHHRRLDAAPRHRAGDAAVVADRHGGAGQPGTGSVQVDDAGEGHERAAAEPAPQVGYQVEHGAPCPQVALKNTLRSSV
jgi:hypothetical protein